MVSGPNAGEAGSGPAVINANGQATFTYSGKAAGTGTVEATVTNAAGTITSSNVSVVWQPCTLSILGLCINLGNCVPLGRK